MRWSIWQTHEVDFVHRRAWRFGCVDKNDLHDAFGFSAKTATRRIHKALTQRDRWGTPFLVRQQRQILPNLKADCPACASETDFLSTLFYRGNPELFFCLSGVREHEIHLQRSEWLNPGPHVHGTLARLLMALKNKPRIVEAAYTSLTAGESARRYRFVPLSLHTIGEQFGLYVHCLEKESQTGQWQPVNATRSMVLSRLGEARILPAHSRKLKKLTLSLPGATEPAKTVLVRFNPRLNPDQEHVLRHELRLKDGYALQRPPAEMFQFLRQFANLRSRGVWPPLLGRHEGPAPSVSAEEGSSIWLQEDENP